MMGTAPPPTPATPSGAAAFGILAGPGSGTAARTGLPLAVPLPFLLTGVAAAGLFGALLPWVLPDAVLSPLQPHVLAVVHIATLGWLTMTIMGASLQLVPVMIGAPLRLARLIRWQFPLYVTGVTLLVTGFWLAWPTLIAAGGSLVVLAVAHYALVLGATLLRAPSRPLTAHFLIAALAYFCLVVGLGLTAALNLQFGFLGAIVLRLLLVHVLLGVVAWLCCTLIGVSYTLARMFALAHGHDDRLGRWVLMLLNGGILGLALGLALNWAALKVLGGSMLTGAVWLFASDYVRLLRARRRKPLDITQRHAIAAVIALAVVIPAGALATTFGRGVPPAALAALGLVALVGAIGQSIIGYLYKIVPFLVWNARYAPLAGRRKVPLMRDLINQRWASAGWWLINGGLVLSVACLPLPWTLPAQVASGLLGLGLMLGAANVIGIARR